MIEHNKSLTKFWKVDDTGNMIDITDKSIVAFCQSMKKLIGDNPIDSSLVNETTEDIYDYIVEKTYQWPEYIEEVEFKDKKKLKIAFNKFYENITTNTK
tara:strand:+ start:1927 stop:2223 length:297 start_codon:yes stop_codon:yes gene_type:complete